ncbi:MAG: hypothetical protein HY280_09740 [Nitrospinae bacterium]|nr:hypothetical protein [Nitrospinota bacterium]
MDGSVVNAGLEELRALERSLDSDIKNAKASAQKVLDAARFETEALLKERKRRAGELKNSGIFSPSAETTGKLTDGFKLNEGFADKMASEIFRVVSKSGPI